MMNNSGENETTTRNPYAAIAEMIQDKRGFNPYGKNRNRKSSYYNGIKKRIKKRRLKKKSARKARKINR